MSNRPGSIALLDRPELAMVLLAVYHLAWGVVLGVTQISGWEGAGNAALLDSLLAGSLVIGIAIALARRSGMILPSWGQYPIVAIATVGVAAASYAAGGNEGIALSFGFAYLAMISGAFFPRSVVVAHHLLIGIAYGVVVRTTDGSVALWLLVTGLTGAAGWLAGRLNRRLMRMTERVEGVERWRAMLMSALAHDLRSPLATVESTIALLRNRREELTDAQAETLLQGASRQARRSLRLTSDLLDHERIRGGTLHLDRDDVLLRETAREATTYFVETDVRVSIPEGLTVNADRNRLEQILTNLIGNAVKHGRPPIDVRGRGSPDGVELSVRDHGTGVPEGVQARLFGRFAGEGTESVGLGLWIVQHLVEAHEGTVTYEDARPGARFTVRFPAPPEPRHQPVPEVGQS